MTCPNCGKAVDGFVAPSKRNQVTDYQYLCHVGTAANSDIDGYQVIHA